MKVLYDSTMNETKYDTKHILECAYESLKCFVDTFRIDKNFIGFNFENQTIDVRPFNDEELPTPLLKINLNDSRDVFSGLYINNMNLFFPEEMLKSVIVDGNLEAVKFLIENGASTKCLHHEYGVDLLFERCLIMNENGFETVDYLVNKFDLQLSDRVQELFEREKLTRQINEIYTERPQNPNIALMMEKVENMSDLSPQEVLDLGEDLNKEFFKQTQLLLQVVDLVIDRNFDELSKIIDTSGMELPTPETIDKLIELRPKLEETLQKECEIRTAEFEKIKEEFDIVE